MKPLDQQITNSDQFFVLWNPKKGFFKDFEENNQISTSKDITQVWSARDPERLEFMLAEYEDRLKDFIIVEVNQNTTHKYQFNKF